MGLGFTGQRRVPAGVGSGSGGRRPGPAALTVATAGQCVAGDSSAATLHGVMEELVHFRGRVRQVALSPGLTPGDAQRQQLLEACDTLRQGLATHGIHVKVSLRPGLGDRTQRWAQPCPHSAPHAPQDRSGASTWERRERKGPAGQPLSHGAGA